MITTYPTSPDERIEILDVLRGVAIFGILIGNLQWFSGYGFIPQTLAGESAFIDRATHFVIHFLVEGKFYSVFSFLFGFGFAIQIAKADELGDDRATLFKRRLFWLLVIGLLHAYLLWAGDILSIYALMGFVLLLFRRKSTASLPRWAIVLMAVPVVTYILIYILFTALVTPEALAGFEAGQADMWRRTLNSVPQNSYRQILTGYNLQMIVGRYLGLIFEMRLPKILAMFLLGFYAYRRGFFQDLSQHRPLVRRVALWGLILGLTGNILFSVFAGKEAVLPPTPSGIAGVVAYAFGVPAMALFYISAIALLWQYDRARLMLVSVLAPVGRMALTNYLMQTVICVFIFYGYGFGLFGSVTASQTVVIGTAIFTLQIAASKFWLTRFRFGPMEWLWRQLTYKKRLPILR